jgi:hypothetical protein
MLLHLLLTAWKRVFLGATSCSFSQETSAFYGARILTFLSLRSVLIFIQLRLDLQNGFYTLLSCRVLKLWSTSNTKYHLKM